MSSEERDLYFFSTKANLFSYLFRTNTTPTRRERLLLLLPSSSSNNSNNSRSSCSSLFSRPLPRSNSNSSRRRARPTKITRRAVAKESRSTGKSRPRSRSFPGLLLLSLLGNNHPVLRAWPEKPDVARLKLAYSRTIFPGIGKRALIFSNATSKHGQQSSQ